MRCQICKRQLTAVESIAQGIGPECAANYASFVSGCGLTVGEIGVMALSGNATVARQIALTNSALRAVNRRDATYFLNRAKDEYAQKDFTLETLAEAA